MFIKRRSDGVFMDFQVSGFETFRLRPSWWLRAGIWEIFAMHSGCGQHKRCDSFPSIFPLLSSIKHKIFLFAVYENNNLLPKLKKYNKINYCFFNRFWCGCIHMWGFNLFHDTVELVSIHKVEPFPISPNEKMRDFNSDKSVDVSNVTLCYWKEIKAFLAVCKTEFRFKISTVLYLQ